MSGTFLLGWSLIALGLASLRMSGALPESWGFWERATAFAFLLCALPLCLLAILAPLGGIRPLPCAVSITLVWGLSHLFTPTSCPPERPWTRLDLLGGTLLGGALARWWSLSLFHGTRFTWDDFTYHAVAPAWWVQEGTLSIPPFNYQGTFPLAAEALAAWFMVPNHSDTHASIGSAFWALLAATALCTVAQQLGQRRSLSMGAAGALLMATPIWELNRGISPTDLAATAALLAAAAFAFAPADGTHTVRAKALLCGLALGVAVGTKVLMAPAAVLLTLWLLSDRATRSRESLALFLTMGILGGGWWYLRTLAVTGNPLFPSALGPLWGPLDRDAAYETSLLPFIREQGTSLAFWNRLMIMRWDWPRPLGVLSALGWVCLLVGALRRKAGPRGLLLTVAFASILLFIPAPFSGTRNAPESALHDFARYLCLPFAVGLAGFGLTDPQRPRVAAIALVTLCLATAQAVWHGTSHHIAAMLLGALVVALASQVSITATKRRWAVGLLSICVVLLTPLKRNNTLKNLAAWPDNTHMDQRIELIEAIEALPPGSRIGHFSALEIPNRFVYRQFGRSLQHEVLQLKHDGSLRPPPFLGLQRGMRWWDHWALPEVDADTLERNLQSEQVDAVIVSRSPTCPDRALAWPRHRILLDRSPIATLRITNPCFALFVITPAASP